MLVLSLSYDQFKLPIAKVRVISGNKLVPANTIGWAPRNATNLERLKGESLPPTPAETGYTLKPPSGNDGKDLDSVTLAEIEERYTELRKRFDQLGPDDKESISNVVKECSTLLKAVEQIRGGDSSMRGELGDIWWSIIKLKTAAV